MTSSQVQTSQISLLFQHSAFQKPSLSFKLSLEQIASDVTRKHGKKQHDKSDDLSTVYPNLSRVVEVRFFNSKG